MESLSLGSMAGTTALLAVLVTIAGSEAAAAPATQPATAKAAPVRLRDDAPAALKQLWPNREKIRAEKVKAALVTLKNHKDRLWRIRRGTVNGRPDMSEGSGTSEKFTFASRESQNAAVARHDRLVADAEAKLERLKKVPFDPPLIGDVGGLKAGAIGYVHLRKVNQVIDAENVIVTATPFSSNGGVGERQDVWISGVKTQGMVDDQLSGEEIAIHVVGTKTYGTAAGSQRTILLAEPFVIEKFLAN
jgi:hypothetical protein